MLDAADADASRRRCLAGSAALDPLLGPAACGAHAPRTRKKAEPG
jgi:hypothetical protein